MLQLNCCGAVRLIQIYQGQENLLKIGEGKISEHILWLERFFNTLSLKFYKGGSRHKN